MNHQSRGCKQQQAGMTLIEVLVAALILGLGLLGAASAQINALKYTDSARMSTQASFIAYDMLDRMRANATGDYRFSGVDVATSSVAGIVGQDLSDFKRNIRAFGGENARGVISVSDRQVSINIYWDDSRAEKKDAAFQSFTLTGYLADQQAARKP
ncbi:type IV pilus modification protein PilV [Pseudomonas sp. WS 5071]|uniref:type IV pilus modification protein PilV n=1 Tax=Pseudomonas sp. WS 5071 TaxID=2717479 RepID=UPI0014752825|nr:type IV pilus modification protein PilV [Pseudomonas sp. WS 5071]NMY76125.1 type IV pilus modification protein PilV [Pseudomonas sp. WS 5071]